jgi:hypothetical protein
MKEAGMEVVRGERKAGAHRGAAQAAAPVRDEVKAKGVAVTRPKPASVHGNAAA